MSYLIGVLSGEETFTDVLVSEINARNVPQVEARFCTIDAARAFEPSPYRVILDRISHWITYYRTYLKNAALTGTCVINNPFWFSADDKFYNYSLARKLGVSVPRTVCLPSRDYHEDVDPTDLRNLAYPLDWEGILHYVGFPAVLKPYDGYGWRDVTVVRDADELMAAYNDSGEDVMLLQEYIDFEQYVRAFVVGKKHVLPMKYDPHQRRYEVDDGHLEPGLRDLIERDCVLLNEALGYDLNTVEFAIREGVPYAIDFMNPVPEAKPHVIGPEYFSWLVRHLADVMIEYAVTGQTTPYRLRDEAPALAVSPEPSRPALEIRLDEPLLPGLEPCDELVAQARQTHHLILGCGAVPVPDEVLESELAN